MPVQHLNMISKYPDEAEAVMNQLSMNLDMKAAEWYLTPETCSDPAKLNWYERRIYDEILRLLELENLEPSQSGEPMNILNFTWGDSLLTPSQQSQVDG